MTDNDERIINRAIVVVGDDTLMSGEYQDIREEARAALHRLFRDRRRLENEVERLRAENKLLKDSFRFLGVDPETNLTEVERLRGDVEAAQTLAGTYEEENERLREENEDLIQRWDEAIVERDFANLDLARLRRIEGLATAVELAYRVEDGPYFDASMDALRAALEEEA